MERAISHDYQRSRLAIGSWSVSTVTATSAHSICMTQQRDGGGTSSVKAETPILSPPRDALAPGPGLFLRDQAGLDQVQGDAHRTAPLAVSLVSLAQDPPELAGA